MKRKREIEGARRRAIARLLSSEGVVGEQPPAPRVRRLVDQAAYTQARKVWRELGTLESEPDYPALLGHRSLRECWGTWLRQLSPATLTRRAAVALALCASAAMLVAVLFHEPAERFMTDRGEIRQLALEDGSTIALGPLSALSVRLTRQQRTVSMSPGEAFFSVSHQAGRPFLISAGDARISVVGTKLNVKYDEDGLRVFVLEGLVHVTPPATADPSGSKPLSVSAGEQAIVRPNEPPALEIPPRPWPDTWRTGQLAYSDVPLNLIIADVNRYVRRPIRLDSARLAQVHLTTSFRTDQIERFIDSLPGILPLSIEHHRDGEVVLKDVVEDRGLPQ